MSTVSGGTLYIVSTPIGNMGDITLRAIECLKEVDLVACEDTRHTGMLLSRLGFKKPYISYNDVNAASRVGGLVNRLLAGESIALVSDAGTPGVSDPAYRLVKDAVAAGIIVQPVPGASAVLSALVVSGFPLDRFVFEGFLPPKGAKRRRRILYYRYESRTVILYESPHRIVDLVSEMTDILGGARLVSVSRELTKQFEETIRGTLAEVLATIQASPVRGEYTVVLHGAEDEETA